MRLLYDDTLAGNLAGTGTYVRGMRAALAARPDVDLVTTSTVLSATAGLELGRKSPLERARSATRHLRYYLGELPSMARRRECDAIFCPSFLGPLRGTTPSFITVHDLSPLVAADTMERLSGLYIRWMLRVGLRRSAGIVTVSRAMATEIRQRVPWLPEDRLTVAANGPNPGLLDAVPSPVELDEAPFLLMVGTLEPRKNQVTALRAFAEHLRRRPRSPLRLVLAGSPGWRYASLMREIEALGPRVLQPGSVSLGQLKWLYQHAEALLFPSIYEGFGLPVLEALSLRCPVVAAGIPAVRELAGDTAFLLDPLDVEAWSSAVASIEDGSLPDRRQAGYQRAQQFNWDASAGSLVEFLDSARARR